MFWLAVVETVPFSFDLRLHPNIYDYFFFIDFLFLLIFWHFSLKLFLDFELLDWDFTDAPF